MSIFKKTFALSACAFALAALSFAGPAWPENSGATNTDFYQVTFPANQDFGNIFALEPKYNFDARIFPGTKLLGRARGTVRLPRHWPLMFAPNDSISENASVLAAIPADAFVALNLEKLSLGDKQIANILHMKRLECLEMEGSEIGDAGLTKLQALKSLKKLSVFGTEVTGATVKELASLPNLHRLSLGCNRFKLQYIEDLIKLKQLRQLNLERTKLTDKECLTLSRMQNLKVLEIQNNPAITSAGLAYLKKMPNLRTLDLRNDKLSAADLIGLKSTKLECVVVSPESYSKADLASIRAALKGKNFFLWSRTETISPELFAPLK